MKTSLLLLLLVLLSALSTRAEVGFYALVRTTDGEFIDIWQFDSSRPPKIPDWGQVYHIPRFQASGWWHSDGKWKKEDGSVVTLSDVIAWCGNNAKESITQQFTAALSGSDELGDKRIDALQSELVGVLLHAYMQTTELLQLAVKAIAGTTATNNLTPLERARVVALRSQLTFPQQGDLSKEEKDRAVAIRDKVLIPHWKLYHEAVEAIKSAKVSGTQASLTNAVVDP